MTRAARCAGDRSGFAFQSANFELTAEQNVALPLLSGISPGYGGGEGSALA